MRTPLARVELLHRVGGFIEERLARRSTDMSTMPPMRKPSRMPFFTQAFTRQPVAMAASGSAARMRPVVQRGLELVEQVGSARRCTSAGLSSKRRSISACNGHSPRAARRLPAPSRSSPDWPALGGHHRQAADRLEQPHQRHRGLHRNRIRLDEVDVHQRQELRAGSRARPAKSPRRQACASCVISPGISFDATEMTPRPPSAISGR